MRCLPCQDFPKGSGKLKYPFTTRPDAAKPFACFRAFFRHLLDPGSETSVSDICRFKNDLAIQLPGQG